MVVCKTDTVLTWDAGIEAIAALTVEDVDLNWLENFIYDIEVDEDDNVSMDVVKERVSAALNNLRDHVEGYSRMLNTWRLFGHTIYLFAETSWGDADEIFDDIGILDVCPSVMEAIGFITDFDPPAIGADPSAVEVASAERLP